MTQTGGSGGRSAEASAGDTPKIPASAEAEFISARRALDEALARNAAALRAGASMPVGLGAMLVLERRLDAAVRAAGVPFPTPEASPHQIRSVLDQVLREAERSIGRRQSAVTEGHAISPLPSEVTAPIPQERDLRRRAKERRPIIMWE